MTRRRRRRRRRRRPSATSSRTSRIRGNRCSSYGGSTQGGMLIPASS